MSSYNHAPNKNGNLVPCTLEGVKEFATITCLSALELDTNCTGTRSVELMVITAGENLSENGWQLACEHADNYMGATNGAYFCSPCGESGDSHLCEECGEVCDENDDEYEGAQYIWYLWQLSESGSHIGGGSNDQQVIEELLANGGIEKSEDNTKWTFGVRELRKLVDLSVNESKELKYLEQMITGCYIDAKVFNYV